MKLTGKHKLRRVRQTIYDDPGNPFESEGGDFKEMNLFSTPFRATPPQRQDSYNDRLLPGHVYQWPDGRTSQEPGLLTGRPFDDAVESPAVLQAPSSASTIYAPTPQRHGTPTLVREHRRSMSVAVIQEQRAVEELASEYTPPRAHWRRGSIPAHNVAPPVRTEQQEQRNTQFHGFYDDILQDYKKRESRL